MPFRMNLGPCELCEKGAELGAGDRTCEICQQTYGKLCDTCAEAPCSNCGAKLKRTEDVFPHSLFKAIQSGSIEKVESILAGRRVDFDALRDRNTGWHPLAAAALLHNKDHALAIVRLLLGLGATLCARTDEGGRTALILMVRYRVFHTKVAELLAASVNEVDTQGRTALMFAAVGQGLFGQRRGNLSITKHLVSMGADASIQDNSGRTALDHAIRRNDTDQNGDIIRHLQSIQVERPYLSLPTAGNKGGLEPNNTAFPQERGAPQLTSPSMVTAVRRQDSDLACAVRTVFSDGKQRSRNQAIRDLAAFVGFQRLGNNIRTCMNSALLSAVRRGILENSAQGLSLRSRSIADYHNDELQKQFLASLRNRNWNDQNEAVLNFARWLGFARTGGVIAKTAKATIRALVRQGRLERDADSIRRQGRARSPI